MGICTGHKGVNGRYCRIKNPRKRKSHLVWLVLVLAFAAVGSKIYFGRYGDRELTDYEKYWICNRNIQELRDDIHRHLKIDGKSPVAIPPKYQRQNCVGDFLVYEASPDRKDFKIYCRGNHHQSLGLGPNQPVYSTTGEGEETLIAKPPQGPVPYTSQAKIILEPVEQ